MVQADLLHISVKKKKAWGKRGSDIALPPCLHSLLLISADCILAGRLGRLNYAAPVIQTQTFQSEEMFLFYQMINLY